MHIYIYIDQITRRAPSSRRSENFARRSLQERCQNAKQRCIASRSNQKLHFAINLKINHILTSLSFEDTLDFYSQSIYDIIRRFDDIDWVLDIFFPLFRRLILSDGSRNSKAKYVGSITSQFWNDMIFTKHEFDRGFLRH